MMARMPARWGRLRTYFLTGIGGVIGLTAAFAALPALSRWAGWNDEKCLRTGDLEHRVDCLARGSNLDAKPAKSEARVELGFSGGILVGRRRLDLAASLGSRFGLSCIRSWRFGFWIVRSRCIGRSGGRRTGFVSRWCRCSWRSCGGGLPTLRRCRATTR